MMGILAVSGCAADATGTQAFDSESISAMADGFREQGRDDLAEIFADGTVDGADYQATYDSYVACMTSRGYSVSEPALNPADNIRFVSLVDGSGKTQETIDTDQGECSADLQEVEAMYAATATQKMDTALQVALVDCMEERGYEPDRDAQNYQEFLEAAGDDATTEWRVAFSGCLTEAGEKLYPDIPYLPVGY